MYVRGQLLQQAPSNTVGYSEPSISANRWAVQQFYTPLRTENIGENLISNLLPGLFEAVRPITVYKFEHLSRADELADLLYCGSPIATGAPTTHIPYELSQTPPPIPIESDIDASGQVREIISWLDITYDELSQITGIGRSTLFHWQHTEGAPRVANARNIARIHALASLLVKRFGVKGAQSWLQSGPDRPWEYLIAGDIASVEDLLRSTLFGQRSRNFAVRPTVGGEDLPPIVPPVKGSLVRSSRRPRRGRLKRHD